MQQRWRYGVGGLAALLLLAGTPAGAQPGGGGRSAEGRVEALVARGDALFDRDDRRGTTWRAIGFFREALKLEPNHYGALWRAARGFARLADDARVTGRNGGSPAKQGLSYGRRAVAAHPKGVEGHYWAAVCVGQWGNSLGIPSAISQGIAKQLERHLRAARRLDPSYDAGGPDRMLAMYHHTIPWPFRDRDKALFHINRATPHGPKDPRNLFCRAQIVHGRGSHREALGLLRRCLATAQKAVPAQRFRRRCRRLLAEYTGG